MLTTRVREAMLRFTKNVRKSGLGKYALRIARSRPIDVAEMTSPQRRGLQAPPPLFTVTSVELGNTTTKCIITPQIYRAEGSTW